MALFSLVAPCACSLSSTAVTAAHVCGFTARTHTKKKIISREEAEMKWISFSASSVRFKLSVSYVSTAKFINAHFMQSRSSQAQTVCCTEREGRLLFPCKPFDFYFRAWKKQDLKKKKVTLILGVYSLRKGRRVPQIIKADFSQFTVVVAQGITVRSWMVGICYVGIWRFLSVAPRSWMR